jgi:hypothetical protein
MSSFKGQFTKIKDLSDKRRLPRLNKIRLGVKVVNSKGKEYPKETSYFVVPPEVANVYGQQPTELDIMFPINDQEAVFPQRLVWYGGSKGMKCIGDGERAMRIEEPDGTRYDEMKERTCPCELLDHGCSRRAHLLIILPKVNVGGIYQIDLGSFHSIVDINSGLDYIQALIGRFAMVPLKLKRIPRETHGSGRKETHYTLGVFFEGNIDFLNELRANTQRILLTGPKYAVPPPVMENPALDEDAVVVKEDDPDVIDMETGEVTSTESRDAPPSEEEVNAQLRERGMVREETQLETKPEPPKQDTVTPSPERDKVLLREFQNELVLKTTVADVTKWHSEHVLSVKKQLTPAGFSQFVKACNDMMTSLKKKGK